MFPYYVFAYNILFKLQYTVPTIMHRSNYNLLIYLYKNNNTYNPL